MQSTFNRRKLDGGLVIPACPLALNAGRNLDERRQRALFRYYIAAGAGGLAVGVHTTQFAIRDPRIGLFRPVLELAAEEMSRSDAQLAEFLVRIAGVCGPTTQAVAEATLIRELGYHAGLLSLAAMREATVEELIAHCRAVADVIPLIGFYLQSSVGGSVLPCSFWRRFAEIENVVAIKIAPFNRYQTIDVMRAVVEAGRSDIALYTGNDDNIVADLLTPFRFRVGAQIIERRITGGILGHWAVWTHKAVEVLEDCHRVAGHWGETGDGKSMARSRPGPLSPERVNAAPAATATTAVSPELRLLQRGVEITDANAAFFDAANGFAGCIAGLHEVLRRQGLLEGIWCLDPRETLSPGQSEEIERVSRAYPHLNDDAFVQEHRDEWLSG
jgi:hypothetical protein